MNTISIIIRRAVWLIPFGVFGSILTCLTPYVMAYYPLNRVMSYLLFYVIYLALLAVCVVGVLAIEKIRSTR